MTNKEQMHMVVDAVLELVGKKGLPKDPEDLYEEVQNAFSLITNEDGVVDKYSVRIGVMAACVMYEHGFAEQRRAMRDEASSMHQRVDMHKREE